MDETSRDQLDECSVESAWGHSYRQSTFVCLGVPTFTGVDGSMQGDTEPSRSQGVVPVIEVDNRVTGVL